MQDISVPKAQPLQLKVLALLVTIVSQVHQMRLCVQEVIIKAVPRSQLVWHVQLAIIAKKVQLLKLIVQQGIIAQHCLLYQHLAPKGHSIS